MKIMNIGDLTPKNIEIRYYSAMKYKPRILHNTITQRRCSSFLYVNTGCYLYRYEGGELAAGAGDILYIPCGASYSYEILSEDTFCMQFEFDITDSADAETIVFSDVPAVAVVGGDSLGIPDIFGSIVADILSDSHELRRTGNVLLLLSEYADHMHGNKISSGMRRIMPALKYIRENFTEKIYIRHLAEMCYLSETHFRRIFKSETGVPVVEFKNKFMISTAKKMLVCGVQSVGEIADALGFTSIYTFSRTFKKYTGISPTEYLLQSKIK